MKKLITSTLAILLISISFAQNIETNQLPQAAIPNGYYNSANGTGYTLKTQLHNIIKDHNELSYAALYVTYRTSDVDNYYENNGTILDMYTENPNGSECEFTFGIGQDDGTLGNQECQRYNREHLIPQSVFNSQLPMYSDAHFVVPSDKYVNGQRDSFPFGRVGTNVTTYSNGSKKGQNVNSGYSAGYNGIVFEPIDEFKGDIARMILYFAVRYEDTVQNWNYSMFNNTRNQVFTSNAINVLLTWHQNDPVSQRERDRNDAIYARQQNRNPFIDRPEFAMNIWGHLLNNDSFYKLNEISIYPNPSSNGIINLQSEINIDKLAVYSVNGQLVHQASNLEFDSNNSISIKLDKGFYFVQLEANNQTVTKKVVIN